MTTATSDCKVVDIGETDARDPAELLINSAGCRRSALDFEFELAALPIWYAAPASA